MTAETRRATWLALGQVALVLLSVGLGLALGEWRQRRADDARVRLAVQTAVREVVANQARVRDAIPYHDALYDQITAGETQAIELRPAFLVDNAWETAQAAGVVPSLPYPVAETLASIHDTQATYQRLAEVNLALLYFGNVYGGGGGLRSDVTGYAPSVSDLRFFEQRLDSLYGLALGHIQEAGFATPGR